MANEVVVTFVVSTVLGSTTAVLVALPVALVFEISDNLLDVTMPCIVAFVLGTAGNVLKAAIPVLDALVPCGLEDGLD